MSVQTALIADSVMRGNSRLVREDIPQCRLLGQLTVVEAKVLAKQLPYCSTEAETEAGDKISLYSIRY